jgi:ferredoxin
MAPISPTVPTSAAPEGTDVLRWPVIGSFLRWRHARTSLQLVLLAVAAVIVIHGFVGPDIASANLATVLTWVHYRGLLVIALLAAGNFFCTGCPIVRTRDWARRLHAPSLHWPSRLRGKWIAAGLFAAVLFAYELFDLWALPGGTAYLVLGYFVAAIGIDTVFIGASFCKHVCPIGQFNFVASTVSPLELRIRDAGTCASCSTADCIKGRRSVEAPMRVLQRGCELGLFLPAKVGNIDCTFCLDCVQACPHDNVALASRAPGLELVETARRSGIGRLTDRPDIALLVVLFVFGAMMNAFAMTQPVYRVEGWLTALTGGASEAVVLGILFVFGLGLMPAVLLGAAAAGTGAFVAPQRQPVFATAVRYVFALVPFGLGVWLAHYGFHLLTGALVVVPVTQSAALDLLGWPALGEPLWRLAGMRPGSVFPIQLGFMLLGTAGSLGLVHLISLQDYPERPARASAPWVAILALLAAAAVWVLLQPMEMRGVGFTQ